VASVRPCSSPPHVPANDQPPPNLRHQGDRAPGLGASGIPPKALGSAFDRFPPWFLRPQPAQSTRPPLPLVSCSSPMISGAPSFPPKSSAQCVVATNPPLMRGALLFSLAPSLGSITTVFLLFLPRSERALPPHHQLPSSPSLPQRKGERKKGVGIPIAIIVTIPGSSSHHPHCTPNVQVGATKYCPARAPLTLKRRPGSSSI
jgi:hypothetical protein